MKSETILYDENGLVIYSYWNIFKDTKFGYKIYANDDKVYLVYESAGFESYEDARNGMKTTLEYLVDNLSSQSNKLTKG